MRIDELYFSTEKDIPIAASMLCNGFKNMLDGKYIIGQELIVSFYMAVYGNESRKHEKTTKQYVDKIRVSIGLSVNDFNRDKEIHEILRQACEMQFKNHILPLFFSMKKKGYVMNDNLICIRKEGCKHLVVDGKNRTAILAAMGCVELQEGWWTWE